MWRIHVSSPPLKSPPQRIGEGKANVSEQGWGLDHLGYHSVFRLGVNHGRLLSVAVGHRHNWNSMNKLLELAESLG